MARDQYKIDCYSSTTYVWYGLYKRTWFFFWKRLSIHGTRNSAREAYFSHTQKLTVVGEHVTDVPEYLP